MRLGQLLNVRGVLNVVLVLTGFVRRVILQLSLVLLIRRVPLLVTDHFVVEVLQVLQKGDNAPFVVLFTRLFKRVVLYLQHLQFVLVLQRVQVVDRLVQGHNPVFAHRKHIQTFQVVQAFQFGDVVRKEGQVFKFAQVVQTFDLGDQVEAEVEPAKIHQRVKSLDLRNDIVVQLQFGQVLHPHQIVNFHNV